MDITNPPEFVSYILTAGLEKLQFKILDIGTWDMDTYNAKTVTHGITSAIGNVLGCWAWVRNDANNLWTPIEKFDATLPQDAPTGGVYEVTSTVIRLRINTSGVYSTLLYTSEAFSRGKILVVYLV